MRSATHTPTGKTRFPTTAMANTVHATPRAIHFPRRRLSAPRATNPTATARPPQNRIDDMAAGTITSGP